MFWIKLITDWDWVWALKNLSVILSAKLWEVLSDRHKNLESESLLKVESESLLKVTEFLSRIDRDFNELMFLWEIAHLAANQVITCKDKARVRLLVEEMLSAVLIYLSTLNIVVASSLGSSLSGCSLFERIGINLVIVILGALVLFSSM